MPHPIAIALRYAPYAAGALLLAFAVWAIRQNGIEAERAKWVAKEVAAQEAQRAREAELQAQVDAAGAALSMSTAEIERLSNQSRIETRNYYVQNPAANVQCLGPDRVRAVQASDEAAYTAATAR